MLTTRINNQKEFNEYICSDLHRSRTEIELFIAKKYKDQPEFYIPGYCLVCKQAVDFRVDRLYGSKEKGIWIPNWRERLICPLNYLNSRQRAVAWTLKDRVERGTKKGEKARIYFTEQITDLFKWAIESFKEHDLYGSEYFGTEYKSGDLVRGINHQDIECLSFEDNYFNVVICNDVMEHVNNPASGFAELARVLNPNGFLLLTIPFTYAEKNVTRAKMVNGKIRYFLESSYHGNPLDEEKGSLVFTDFGWEVIDMMKSCGFKDVCMEIFWKYEYGHLGGTQFYITATV